MLPEKKKRLIIGIIAIIVCVIVVIGLWKLSSFIKNRNNEYVKNNSEYSENYEYFGVLKDSEGIYRVYGINESEEVYLSLKTFYEVKDILVKDKRLILYSDAVNEVRYDKDINEYYFYELDSYYNNKEDISLAKDYLVTYKDKVITYWKYGDDDKKKVSNVDSYLVYENKLYYVTNNMIMEYDLDTGESNTLVNSEFTLTLLSVNNEYLYYKEGSILYSCKLSNYVKYNESELVKGEYLAITDTGLLLSNEGKVKNYDINNKRVINELEFDQDIEKVYKIKNSLFYFKFSNNYVIIDIDKGEIVSDLENDYLYLVGVM